MATPIDLTGKTFGRLTVISFSHTARHYNRYWNCICECGVKKCVSAASLSNGNAKSCGCYLVECRYKNIKHGNSRSSGKTPEYNAWQAMKRRCDGKNTKLFNYYGGRGIYVCERWLHSFDNFLLDMGEKPSIEHSLDRFPDTDGNYEPSNCRWATDEQQRRNKRNNVWIEFEGVKMILNDWANYFGISRMSLKEMIGRVGKQQAMIYYKRKYKNVK